MGVSAVFLLSSLGFAIVVQAQDCTKPEPGLNMSLSDEDILKETFPDGSTARFKCSTGYQTAGGSRTVTCTAGSWSPVLLKCEKKNCGSAEKIQNGSIEYEGTEFGDTATYVCEKGYRLIGNSTITCGDQGWMGRAPTCEDSVAVQDCTKPEPGPNMEFSDEDISKETFPDGSTAKFKCNTGYQTAGGSRTVTCTAGSWSPVLLQCEKKSCGPAGQVANAKITYEGTEFGDKATYVCEEGYNMIGNPVITCGDQGWMGRLPTCHA